MTVIETIAAADFMHAADSELFNRPRAEAVRMRKAIEDYLTYLNCETRNSTSATCQEWKTSLVQRPPYAVGLK
jgi:hypothetical protein